MTIGFLLEQCFPHSSVSKESACNVGDPGSILGLGRSPGEGNGNPLQYSCLGNPMDGGAWQATVHGVARVRHDLVTKPPPPRQDPKLPPTKKLPTHRPSGKIPYKLMCCVSLVAPACNAGDQVHFLGWEDLEKATATYSSILAWKIPWTEEHGGLQFTGSKRVGYV